MKLKSNDLADQLKGSLLLFTKYFFQLRTKREFAPSNPEPPRESHYITICRALTKVFKGESLRLYINVPPRYAKTEILCHFIPWAWAKYPDCNFLYVSVTHDLASMATRIVRDIVELPQYQKLFGIRINPAFSARDYLRTNHDGSIFAIGAEGTITGKGAGIKGVGRFGGAIVIDDIHKPEEVASANNRKKVKSWFFTTLSSRVNDPKRTPIIAIGQRLHEGDLFGEIEAGIEGLPWDSVVLPGLDANKKALDRDRHTREQLEQMEKNHRYVYSAQIQQRPQPEGGGLYQKDDFYILPKAPTFLCSFITCDTAETSKETNDATVFSFWGMYNIMHEDAKTPVVGLHWALCEEIRVEPKDLEYRFNLFYLKCLSLDDKLTTIAIEKKSTGTTLLSLLSNYRGIKLLEIPRHRGSGSKIDRFIRIQPYISSKRISLTEGDPHVNMCLEHMMKITNNGAHSHDDICDTVADAVQLALIDKSIYYFSVAEEEEKQKKAKLFASPIKSTQFVRFTQDWRN